MSSSHDRTGAFRLHPLAAALCRARLPLLAGSAVLCLAGPAVGAPVEVNLSGIVAGDGSGFALNGIADDDESGFSVSAAGDVNGDGVDDVIIGAFGASPNGGRSGQSYVVFGRTGGFAAELGLSALQSTNGGDGTLGFVVNGIAASDYSGRSVSAAGDLNGDGIDDVIIGAYGADPNSSYSGQSYVVFGHTGGFAAELELSALQSANGGDGTLGFVLNGAARGDRSGRSVSAAGDLNGDGIGDVIIGAFGADPNGGTSGQSNVVFGHTGGFAAELELSALQPANGGDGSAGFVLNGVAVFDQSGTSVSAAGDLNGDGIDDVIIGAPGANPNGDNSGQSYAVFGHTGGFAAELELSALQSANGGDGTLGIVVNGAAGGDASGVSVSAAGDVNGDGIDDVVIGAYGAAPNGSFSGQSYVVFGHIGGFATELELSALQSAHGGDGSSGFVVNGASGGDYSGRSVSAAGDVNGDGIDDVIIGAQGADPNGDNSGQSYVVFGHTGGFPAELEVSALKSANGGDGSSGFVLNGADGDRSGVSVSAAGDVNGDDIDDVVIGSPRANADGSYSGQSYVVYGSDTTPDAFAFTPAAVSGAALNSHFTSNTVTVTGLDTSAPISVSGGAYTLDGIDFTTGPGSIAPGAQTAVQVLSSMLYSGTAEVTLTIGTADGVSATFTATTEEATVGVDSPSPFPEGNSGSSQMMIPVSLNGESALPVAVDYDVSGLTATAGVDFQPTSDTLMIPAGATGANVLVDILGDVLDEPDEQLLIQLSNPSAASLGQALATATIQDDDDPPAISISDLQVLEGTSRSQAGLTVSLSAPSGKTVSVDYATADGSALAGQDYTAAGGTVTFAPGTTQQTILLDVTSDNLPEPDENFFINLSNPQYATIADAQAEVTILDDDLPRLSINDVGVPEPEDGQQTPANFTVTLQNPILGETVTVDYLVQPISATTGLDYLPATGTLSFPPGTTTQPIGVTVLGDADVESTEQFVVTLSNPSNASIADGSGLGSIYEHTTVIFTDGFESGDTSAWSSEVGGS